MTRTTYKCGECGSEPGRDNLVVKRVEFANIGRAGKVLRRRSVAFLCQACMQADKAYTQEPYTKSPGNVKVDNPS